MAIKYHNFITQFNGVENEKVGICRLEGEVHSIKNFGKNYKKWQILDSEKQIISVYLHNPTCSGNSLCSGSNIDIKNYFSEGEKIDIILANDFMGDYVYEFRNVQKKFPDIEKCQNAGFFSIENIKNSSLVFLQNHSETGKEFEDLMLISVVTIIILFLCFVSIFIKILKIFYKKFFKKSPK